MLSPQKTLIALQAKSHLWQQLSRQAATQTQSIYLALQKLSAFSSMEIIQHLAGTATPGALPTAEHDSYPGQCIPFPYRFANHQDARAWARERLSGQPTFAADGSQIAPMSEFALPVAAAQVGWYLNYHEDSGRYEKDLDIEVFLGPELQHGHEGGMTHVETRRFQMEVAALVAFIERAAGMQPKPVCFFDGPLVVSFVSEYAAQRSRIYIDAISQLLEAAEAAHVPLIGYIANSAASDVLSMLVSLSLTKPVQLADAPIFNGLLPQWGDRSATYICARGDGSLKDYSRADGSSLADQVCFCYLRVTGDGKPARLEFPRWLYNDQEEYQRVLDIIRAECIVGLGYPYAIETADQTAVISNVDSEKFKRILEQFAGTQDWQLPLTAKARSKKRRRYGG